MKIKLFFTAFLLTFSTLTFAFDTPTEDFIDNNDGTVTHKKTGLSWQRCSVGQTWTGSSCSGTASTMNWSDAVAKYENKTDCNQWRLPRIDELNTIAENSTYNPSINSNIFPNTLSSYFWSTSVDASSPSGAWIVGFSNGYDGSESKINYNAVRLVRGGQSCSLNTFTPSIDFIDNGNGTVIHQKTGLMWQRCSIGQTWNGTSCTGGGASSMDYAAAISQTSQLAGYNDWRLPTLNELHTIVEYKNSSPVINTTIFPDTPLIWFWSASTYAPNSNYAWFENFNNGYDDNYLKRGNFAVRLVRGTWTAPTTTQILTTIDLSTTISASTSHVKLTTLN
ncbi:MAG: DUF1566 domain-containing protein [Methylococcales bacterium]|nr:DUF1566 domain-containing protein [Methylococcales bacterium]